MTPPPPGIEDDPLLRARALVLHDLQSTDAADPATVSALEAVIEARRWWHDQWPDGAAYLVGLIAQDLQDHLLGSHGRWPLCRVCDPETPVHGLYVHPDLGGPDPAWVCEDAGVEVAALGSL